MKKRFLISVFAGIVLMFGFSQAHADTIPPSIVISGNLLVNVGDIAVITALFSDTDDSGSFTDPSLLTLIVSDLYEISTSTLYPLNSRPDVAFSTAINSNELIGTFTWDTSLFAAGGYVLDWIVSDPSGNTASRPTYLTLNPDPIPEPSTMLLIGTGLVGLAGFRRKFRK